jgi:lactoylglutathione lyase
MKSLPGPLLTLLVLKSHRVDALVPFYTALGVTFAEERHGDGPLHFTCRIGDTTLELYPLPADAGPADATTRLGVIVPNLRATLERLSALGVNVGTLRETPWGLRALVRDPDGRTIELYHAP